mgnify:CR=1 FL=1
MNCLEERILKDGIVKEGNVLKVDSFLIIKWTLICLMRWARNGKNALRVRI